VTLRVPDVGDQEGEIQAAIKYAENGWYVLPVEPDSKRPAKILGNAWQHQTSRDADQIADWFAGTSLMVGLHVGRSGAVVLDVDYPDKFPAHLRHLLAGAAFQSTRTDLPERGHYVFAAPRLLGNSRGELGQEFGEVRGTNGIIVVAPSRHTKPMGRYHWVRTGEVPCLPDEIDRLLPDGQRSEDAATDADVRKFMAENNSASMAHLLKPVLKKMAEESESGSRHEALVRAAVWAMREARAGFYPAKTAIDAMWQDFDALMHGERFPMSEFRGVVAWAVSQALATDPGTRKVEVQTRLAAKDAAQKASVQTTAPTDIVVDEFEPPRPPGDYFGKEGIDNDLLATDVLNMGPLLWGRDGGFWSYANGVWQSDPLAVERRCVQLLSGKFRGNHASNAATAVHHQVGTISCEPTIDHMNFSNGMLDWRTGELQPHAPHFGSTVQFPIAWTGDRDTPIFDKWLAQTLSPDYVEFVWEMLGYMLMSGNPLQVAFMFYGTGRNGKGTLMRVIEHMLGASNVSAVDLDALNTNRFAAASLFGRIANLAGDIDPTFQENTGRFKKITGGDVMDAEEKHRQSFRFTSWAVPVFSANKVPGSSDTSFGYLRRWKIVRFQHEVTDADVDLDLDTKLEPELPAIAARAVEALRPLMERRNFKSDGDIARGLEEFADTIDQVRQWANDETRMVAKHREAAPVCYSTYRSWADKNGNGRLKAQEFYSRLEGMGLRKVKSSGNWFIEGLMIAPGHALTDARDVPRSPLADDLPDPYES
jgi:putative DNA primase/helicase